MFRHHGNTRTHTHNIKIAALLSFVAGSVNVAGFLLVHRLTTNVTGHFAFFVEDFLNLNFAGSLVLFLFVIAFFAGAFVSSTLIEIVNLRSGRNVFLLPVALEIIVLTATALGGPYLLNQWPDVIALCLLFAMGIQNSLVTRISNAVVRTTHLTGLFTDLGIELSQLIFCKAVDKRQKLWLTIKLRLTIISFFFGGGVVAGLVYGKLQFYTLLIAVALLTTAIIYDYTRFKVLRWVKSR